MRGDLGLPSGAYAVTFHDTNGILDTFTAAQLITLATAILRLRKPKARRAIALATGCQATRPTPVPTANSTTPNIWIGFIVVLPRQCRTARSFKRLRRSACGAGLLHDEIVPDGSDAGNARGEFTGASLHLIAVDEAAELDNVLEGLDADVEGL
jgi:hypothetical protein